MTRRGLRVDGASVRVRGEAASSELATAIARRVVDAARGQRVLAERVEVDGQTAWIKGDHLPGKARWRHSLAALLGRPTPRERELERLGWLRARLFRAPRPLLAGTVSSFGRLRYQFLAMAPLEAHEPLEAALVAASPDERRAWIEELAREVARLHALRFVHRNLFLRNVLVDRAKSDGHGDPRRLIFVDPWRGGASLPFRDVAYDLGALMLDAAQAWSAGEQAAFFERYFAERAVQDRPAAAAPLLEAAAARRRALARRSSERGDWERLALTRRLRGG